METRPKLKIPLSTGDKVLEALGWFAILGSWLWVFLVCSKLPSTIPTHFGASGVANAFGPKSGILGLPTIATISFIVLSILNQFPHIFNYPQEINGTNALRQYTNATKMVRFLKFAQAVIFLTILILASLTALHKAAGLGFWFLPASLAFVFIPMAFYLCKAMTTH